MDEAAPKIGVWDQWTVLNNRPYSKEGESSLHDEAACRLFLANFRNQKNDLPANISHEKTTVVGWYNALALFIGGKLVDIADHAPGVFPDPTIEDLPRGADGSPPDDGIYWRRARLTDVGLKSKQYLRYVSPEFYMQGKNEHGDTIGPLAVGGAWTNYPFLDGNELNEYERKPTMGKKKSSYASRCYEEAGVGKDDDDKTKYSKLAAYWRGQNGAKFGKYEEAAGVSKEDDDSAKMTKVMSYMTGKFEKDEDEEEEKMTGPTVSGEAPPVVHGGEPNKDPVAGQSMEKAEAFQAFAKELGLPSDPVAAKAQLQTFASMKESLPQMSQQLRQLQVAQQMREEESKAILAKEFVRDAWNQGKIFPRKNEKHSDARDRILQLYTKSGKEAAEAALLEPGSFTPPEAMGGPIHYRRDNQSPTEFLRPDEEILHLAEEKMKAKGITPKNGAGVYDARLVQFAREVCQENPSLAQKYKKQSSAALLEGLV